MPPVISTFEALVIALLALLPGASYTFAYERLAGAFGSNAADRLVRFLAASAIIQAAYAGPLYVLYHRNVANGDLAAGDLNWLAITAFAVGYVSIPVLMGTLVGWGRRNRYPWALLLTGDSAEPRAWDYLWNRRVSALVRLRMNSGRWLAGIYNEFERGAKSYAAGYPEDGDLFLAVQCAVQADSGDWVLTASGQPSRVDSSPGLLVKWADVEFLEYWELPDGY